MYQTAAVIAGEPCPPVEHVARSVGGDHQVLYCADRSPLSDADMSRAFGPDRSDVSASPWIDLALDQRVVGLARAFTRAHLGSILPVDGSWGAIIEDATLVVSELVTNALTATGRIPVEAECMRVIGLRLNVSRLGVAIQVWDSKGWTDLAISPHDDAAETGRGLQIARSLSRYVNAFQTVGGGKVVGALLPLPRSSELEERLESPGSVHHPTVLGATA